MGTTAEPTTPTPLPAKGWRRARRCTDKGDNCVEVNRAIPDTVGIRDSKSPQDRILTVDKPAWRRFLGALSIDQ